MLMNRVQGERGLGKLTLLVFGLLAAAVVYVSYSILPFFYYYYDLQNQMEQMIRVSSEIDNAEIHRRLWYYIKKYGIPANKEDLIVERNGTEIRISLEYTETFSIPWGEEERVVHEFEFFAHAEGGGT